jgi:hypothetical protein
LFGGAVMKKKSFKTSTVIFLLNHWDARQSGLFVYTLWYFTD